MKLRSNKHILGISAAGFTAVFQGIEGLLYPLFGLVISKMLFQSLGFSIGILAIKEVITLMLLLMIISPKKMLNIIKLIIKSKSIRIFFHAGIWGTSFGNLSFIIAIQLAGASYGMILTSFYPIFSVFVTNAIMKYKQKEGWRVWICIIVATISGCAFIIIPAALKSSHIDTMTIIGVVFGAVAALFWSFEGALISKGVSEDKTKSLEVTHIAFIRTLSSTLMSWIIFLPLSSLLAFSNSPFATNGYWIIAKVLSNWVAIFISIGIAINIILLRYVHIFSIKQIGAKLSAIIDVNNFLIPPFVSIFLNKTNLFFINSNHNLYEAPIWWSWFIIIPILFAIIGVIYFHKPIKNEKIEKILN